MITTGHTQYNKLEQEYIRYTYVYRILNHISSLGNAYETRNIVERWLLSMVNFSNNKFDPIFSNDVLEYNCRFNLQMIHELKEKTIASCKEIEDVIRNVISIVKEYKELDKSFCKDGKYTLKNGIFRYKEYMRKISPARISILLARGSCYDIAVMLMRYACILPGAQHWNIPKSNYKIYYDDGVRIEGFASPINAQLITIDPECKFCSLFPDVDRIFGSIGNFFTTSFVGQKVAVNPPFTVELFDKIATKIISECEISRAQNKQTIFYVNFGAWEDTYGYNLIKNSNYCTFVSILPEKTHYYINTNKATEDKVTAKFRTAFFYIGHPISSATKDNYNYLFKGMMYDNTKPIIQKQI